MRAEGLGDGGRLRYARCQYHDTPCTIRVKKVFDRLTLGIACLDRCFRQCWNSPA